MLIQTCLTFFPLQNTKDVMLKNVLVTIDLKTFLKISKFSVFLRGKKVIQENFYFWVRNSALTMPYVLKQHRKYKKKEKSDSKENLQNILFLT